MHPDDAERVRAIINAVNVETGPITSEYRVFTKEGDTIWAETTFSRLSDGSGRLLGVSRDVTARRQLEDDLRDALARSEAAAAAKTDFLANMTHELRTSAHRHPRLLRHPTPIHRPVRCRRAPGRADP